MEKQGRHALHWQPHTEVLWSVFKLAVIPARAGSKRIPGKNIRDFGGRPMLAWPISAAVASGLFDKVIVSTDSEQTAALARAWGAETPFMRPPELSNDLAGTRPVIAHAIRAFAECTGSRPGWVCCIYATAAFLRPEDLRAGHDRLRETGADFVYSVSRFPAPIQRALRIRGDGRVEMMQPEHRGKRSQDLEPAYHDAGQFYWGKAEAFLDLERKITSPASAAVVLPAHRAPDIDTEEDWKRAEWLFKAMRLEEGAAAAPCN